MFDLANPRQVVLVTTRGKAKIIGKESVKDNIITIAWHSPLSFEPPLYGISVGKTRFSHKLLEDGGVFAVNFVAHDLKDDALFCGRSTGESTDKFEKSKLTKEECETIDCCSIREASAVMECEIVDAVDAGDHTFFVGKILKSKSGNDRKRLVYVGQDKFTSTL